MMRGLLLFVAGALLGANIVYYLLRTRGADCPAPVAQTPVQVQSPDAPAPITRTPTPAPRTPAPAPVIAPGGLAIPVAGIRADQLIDTYTQSRGAGRLHDAIDIMAPAGTPVLAAVDGRIVKLFESAAGGITLYQFDAAERHVYYYAHLQGYAPGIAEGRVLKRGDVLGYVGFTGNASPDGPHLHFAIAVLGPDKRWHGGTPVNPYPLLTGKSPQLTGKPAAVPPPGQDGTPRAAGVETP